LTLKHLELFKRFASRIIILFDGDKAGIAATDKAMELGLSQGMVLHGASLPDGLDPDEILFQSGKLLPEGKERMSTILKSARPLIDTQIEAAGRQAAQSAEDRTLAIKRVANWLALFTDPVGKAVRLQEAEKVLGVSSEILDPRSAGRTRPAQPSRPPRASLPPPRTGTGSAARPVASPPLTTAEKILLAGLARGGKALEAAQQALSKMPPDTAFAEIFSHPGAQGVLQAAEKRGSLALGAEIFSGGPLGTRLDPQVQSTLTEAWMSTESPFSFQDFQVALDRALGRAWARFSHRIIAALKEAEAKKDAGLQSQLMKEYLDVQRRMKEFNTFPETD
jgi:DNA primase